MFEARTLPTNDAAHDLVDSDSMETASFTVDPENRVVIVKFGKKITREQIARYARELRAHPDFEPAFSEIADLRDAEEIDLQGPDFIKLADQVDPFSPEAERAFLAQTPTRIMPPACIRSCEAARKSRSSGC